MPGVRPPSKRFSVIRAAVILILILCTLGSSPKSERPAQVPHRDTVISVVTPSAECDKVSDVLGFAVVDVAAGTVLPFFAKPDGSKPALTVRLYYNQATKSISHRVEGGEQFRPATLHLDYDLWELSVKNKQEGWLKVVVDEQTGKTLWVRERRPVKFVGWLSKMRGAFSIERTRPKANPLRTVPGAKAREVKLAGRDCFKADRMRGDWIRVVQQDHCDGASRWSASGWIRWRDDRGCLLVHIYPFA